VRDLERLVVEVEVAVGGPGVRVRPAEQPVVEVGVLARDVAEAVEGNQQTWRRFVHQFEHVERAFWTQ